MWKIDRDYLADNEAESRVGTSEEHDRIPLAAAVIGIMSEPLPDDGPLVRFRLLDDDGEVYYGGELHDDDECLNQAAALDFGMADAGCTEIQVKRSNAWVTEIA